MPTNPTPFQTLKQLAQAEIQGVDPTLTDFSEGSNLDAISGAAAVLANETNRVAIGLYRDHLLDFAEGDALRTLGLDRYGLDIQGASKSVGTVLWTEGSASNYTIPAGTTVEGIGPDGATFQAITKVAAESNSGHPIPVESVNTGRASNVPAGTLTAVASAFTTDATATVTQGSRMAGGGDAETDAQYRARLRFYYNTLSEATRNAVIRAVSSVPGIRYVIPRVDYNADGSVVDVYVADVDGEGNSVLAAEAQVALDNTIALGIKATARPAVREDYSLLLVCYVPAGVDTANADAQIRAGVLNYANNVVIGDSVYESALFRAAHNAYSRLIRAIATAGGSSFEEIEPSGAVNTLRLSSANLTINFVEVNQ